MTLRDLVVDGPAFVLGGLLWWRLWAATAILLSGLLLAGWIVDAHGVEAWVLVWFLGALSFWLADGVGES